MAGHPLAVIGIVVDHGAADGFGLRAVFVLLADSALSNRTPAAEYQHRCWWVSVPAADGAILSRLGKESCGNAWRPGKLARQGTPPCLASAATSDPVALRITAQAFRNVFRQSGGRVLSCRWKAFFSLPL